MITAETRSLDPQAPPAATPLARRHPGQAGAIGGLADTALAVVVGTLTLVGVVGFFQSSSTSARANSEVANLVSLVANIRSAYYQAGSNYAGISAGGLATSRIAPTPLIRGANLTSMFGAPVTVAPNAAADEFTVSYSAMPPDACVKLSTTIWTTLSDITTTTINGTTPSFDMNGATTNCTQSTNAIVFTFR